MNRRTSIKNSSSTHESDDEESIVIEELVAKARAIHDAKRPNILEDIEAIIKKNYRRSVVRRAVNPPYVVASTPCGRPTGMTLSQNISSISNASNEIADSIPNPSIHQSFEKVAKINGVLTDSVNNSVKNSSINHELSQKISIREPIPETQTNVQCSNHEQKNTSSNRRNSHHSQKNVSRNSGSKLQSVLQNGDSDSSVFIEDEPCKKSGTFPKIKINGSSVKVAEEIKENSRNNHSNKNINCSFRYPETKPPSRRHEDLVSSCSSYNLRQKPTNFKTNKNGYKINDGFERKRNYQRKNRIRSKRNNSSDDSSEEADKARLKSKKNGEFKSKRPSKYLYRRNESVSSSEEGTTRSRISRRYSRPGRKKESRRKTIRSSESRKTYHNKHKRLTSRPSYHSKSGRKKHYSSSSYSGSASTDSDDEKTITKSRRMSRVEKYEQDMKYGRRKKSCNSRKSTQRKRDSSDEEDSKRRRRPTPGKLRNQTRTETKASDSETLSKVVNLIAAQLLNIRKDEKPICSNEQPTAVVGCCSNAHIRNAPEKNPFSSGFDWNKFLGNNDPKKNWMHKYNDLPGRSLDLAQSDEWPHGATITSPIKAQVLKKIARAPFKELDPRTRTKLQESKFSECSVENDGTNHFLHKSRNQNKRKVSNSKRNLNEILTRLSACNTISRRRKNLNTQLKTDKSKKAVLDEIVGYQKKKTVLNKFIVKIKDQATSPFVIETNTEFSPRRKVLQETMLSQMDRYQSSPLFGWGTKTMNGDDLDYANTTVKENESPKTRSEMSEPKRKSKKMNKSVQHRSIQTSREFINDETLKPEINAENVERSVNEEKVENSIGKPNKDHNSNSRIQKILQLSRKRLSFGTTSGESGSTEREEVGTKSKRSKGKVLKVECSDEDKSLRIESEASRTTPSNSKNGERVMTFSIGRRPNDSLDKRKSARIDHSRPNNPVNVSLYSSVEFSNVNMARRTRSSRRNTQDKALTSLNEEIAQNSTTKERNAKIIIHQNVTVARKKYSNVNNNNRNISYAPNEEDEDGINAASPEMELNVTSKNSPVFEKKATEESAVETENLHQGHVSKLGKIPDDDIEESCLVSTPKVDKSGRKMLDDVDDMSRNAMVDDVGDFEESCIVSTPKSADKTDRKVRGTVENIVENIKRKINEEIGSVSRLRDDSGSKIGDDRKNLDSLAENLERSVSRSKLKDKTAVKPQEDDVEESSPKKSRRGRKQQIFLPKSQLKDDSGSNIEDERKNQDSLAENFERSVSRSKFKDKSAGKPQDDVEESSPKKSRTGRKKQLSLPKSQIKDENGRKIQDDDIEGSSSKFTIPQETGTTSTLKKDKNRRKIPDEICSVDVSLETEKSKKKKKVEKNADKNVSVGVRASTRQRRPPQPCWWKKTVTKRDCEIYGNLFLPTVPPSTTETNEEPLKTKKTKPEPKPKTAKKAASKVISKKLEPSTSVASVSRNVNEIEFGVEAPQNPDNESQAAQHDDSIGEEIWQSISEKVDNLSLGMSSSISGKQIFNTSVEHGILRLAPLEEKMSVNLHYTVIYYVLKGSFSLKIGHKYFETAPALFVIPKGKRYVLHNKLKKPVLLAYIIDDVGRK